MRGMKHRPAATASAISHTVAGDGIPQAVRPKQHGKRTWDFRTGIFWVVLAYYIYDVSYPGQTPAPVMVSPPIEIMKTTVPVPDEVERQAMAVKQRQEELREAIIKKNEKDKLQKIRQEERRKPQKARAAEEKEIAELKEPQEQPKQQSPEVSKEGLPAQQEKKPMNQENEQQRQQGDENAQTSSPPKPSDLTTPASLSNQLAAARNRLQARLVQLYGKHNYQTLFQPWVNRTSGEYYPGVPSANNTTDPNLRPTRSIGDHFLFKSPTHLSRSAAGTQKLPTPDTGWDRMVRKFQIKLLQVMLGAMHSMEECPSDGELCEPPAFHAKYTWMTAGTR